MNDLLQLGAVHEVVVVYHEWWMGVLFWVAVGAGTLGVVGFVVGAVLFDKVMQKEGGDIGPSELLMPGCFLIVADVVLWAVYGVLRWFGFQ
jgi:hypothetical protein